MSYTKKADSIQYPRGARAKFLTATTLALAAMSVSAQQFIAPSFTQEKLLGSVSESSSVAAASALPDAPSAMIASAESSSSSAGVSSFSGGMQAPGGRIAPVHSMNIDAGWQAAQLKPRDKFIMSIQESVSWEGFAGYALSAGYSQATNGQPNYGGGGRAFGQRFGAAAARGASENIFADGVLAPIFHEDPRYYVEGDGHNFFHRVFYSATRPLITQSDSGHKRVNASMLLGYLGASALTSTYYPQINRNGTDIARTYGSSLGGAAVGFVFQEFIGDVVDVFHHKQ
jgi:hypothetical protein